MSIFKYLFIFVLYILFIFYIYYRKLLIFKLIFENNAINF